MVDESPIKNRSGELTRVTTRRVILDARASHGNRKPIEKCDRRQRDRQFENPVTFAPRHDQSRTSRKKSASPIL